MLYGETIAKDLIYFNDVYYKLMSVIIDMEDRGFSSKLDKEGEAAILLLDKHWEKIKIDLATHISLLNELSDLKNNLISRYYQVRRSASNP